MNENGLKSVSVKHFEDHTAGEKNAFFSPQEERQPLTSYWVVTYEREKCV